MANRFGRGLAFLRWGLKPLTLVYLLNRIVLWPRWRRPVAWLLSRLRPRGAPADARSDASRTLGEAGIVLFPNVVTHEQVREILGWVGRRRYFDPYARTYVLYDRLEEMPEEVSVAYVERPGLGLCPHLLDLVNRPSLLALVERELGCKPTLACMDLYWSRPTGGPGRKDQLYHRDVDDWKFLKFFTYLTDVERLEDGAHVFIRGSHRRWEICRPNQVHPEDEVDAIFGAESKLVVLGKAGTGFLANTFGVHRGYPPRRTWRLMLQVVYSLHPYTTFLAYPPRIARAHLRTTVPLDPYVNRLFVEGR